MFSEQLGMVGPMDSFPRQSDIPVWCRWFSPEQWSSFRYVAEQIPVDYTGTPLRLGSEPTRLTTRIDAVDYRLDVPAIARSLSNAPEGHWTQALDEYFERSPWPPREKRDLLRGGPRRVRSSLRLMIDTADRVRSGPEPVHWMLGAGLAAVLCVHGKCSPYWIFPTDVRRWNDDVDELRALAMHNLRREPTEITEDFGWYRIIQNSPYTAANLLRVDELVREPTPFGMLVVIPSFHVIMFHAIRNVGSLVPMKELHELADRLATEAGGVALSRQVLWWSAGWLTEIRVTPTDIWTTPSDSEPSRPVWQVSTPPRLLELLRAPETDRRKG
jgi:hypothetical protein